MMKEVKIKGNIFCNAIFERTREIINEKIRIVRRNYK